MSAPTTEPELTTDLPPLFHTATGAKLHIEPCPHVLGAKLIAAQPQDPEREVCSWCQGEIDGHGRVYFGTDLAAAFTAYGTLAGTAPLIHKVIDHLTYDAIWIPNSSAYIALANQGRVVAWVGKGYVVPVGSALVPLPGYSPGTGAGTPGPRQAPEIVCEVHRTVLPATGVCDECSA